MHPETLCKKPTVSEIVAITTGPTRRTGSHRVHEHCVAGQSSKPSSPTQTTRSGGFEELMIAASDYCFLKKCFKHVMSWSWPVWKVAVAHDVPFKGAGVRVDRQADVERDERKCGVRMGRAVFRTDGEPAILDSGSE